MLSLLPAADLATLCRMYMFGTVWCVAAAAVPLVAARELGGSLLQPPSRQPCHEHIVVFFCNTQGDIVLYERMSWEAAFSLAGQHSADVSLLAFSPNGERHRILAARMLVVGWGRLAGQQHVLLAAGLQPQR